MINIFAKPAFLNINPSQPFAERTKPLRKGVGHLMRVSSIIRGEQIAKQIGARLNPNKINIKKDINIYVKPMVRKGHDFKFEGKPYMDILDGHALGELMINYPKIPVIVCSKVDYETMGNAISNKIYLIPQHHCNFERIKRKRNQIETVGIIGTKIAIDYFPKGFKEGLLKRGIKLLFFSRFFKRQDIIDFYMKIDLQIVWRPYKKILSNPLKIVNASSFGIPTIALDEPAFKEVTGCFVTVPDLKGIFDAIKAFKSEKGLYELISETCLEVAEEYHIDKISKLYKELK